MYNNIANPINPSAARRRRRGYSPRESHLIKTIASVRNPDQKGAVDKRVVRFLVSPP